MSQASCHVTCARTQTHTQPQWVETTLDDHLSTCWEPRAACSIFSASILLKINCYYILLISTLVRMCALVCVCACLPARVRVVWSESKLTLSGGQNTSCLATRSQLFTHEVSHSTLTLAFSWEAASVAALQGSCGGSWSSLGLGRSLSRR